MQGSGRRRPETTDVGRGGARLRDYRNIKAWQLSDDLTVLVHQLCQRFPREEAYGLINAVEKKAGAVRRTMARLTSLIVIMLPTLNV